MNTCVIVATSDPYLPQDDVLALKSLFKKLYHDVYERFVQQESGNYSVEHGSDSAV